MKKEIAVLIVGQEWIHTVWPKVEGFITAALKEGLGEYSLDNVKAELVSGAQTLFIGTDGENVVGSCTVKLYNGPQQKIAYITSYGGKHVTTKELFEYIESWCINMGASKIQAYAKEPQMRLYRKALGFSAPCYVVEKNYA